MDLVQWAEAEGRRRLGTIRSRWLHCQAAGRRATEIAAVVDRSDQSVLVAAALLHDIGYAPELDVSGFHPLDGARWLDGQGHRRLAGLVAHHTGARFEGEALGLAAAVARFIDERSPVSDALTYCDLTTGPAGQRTTVERRLREIEARYGAASVVVRALEHASPSLFAMVERTEQRLAAASVR